MPLENLKLQVKKASNPQHAVILQRFFKTGKGEYGEGDVFVGIKVPVLRTIAKSNPDLTFDEIKVLMKSPVHEERMLALFILVAQFSKADEKGKEKIYKFYLKNTKYINNWDLVDLSAPQIVGGYLYDKDRSVLYKLASSKNLWEKRIAILGTFYFIKRGDFDDAFEICRLMLNDKHDLIHKASGWMIREIGKRSFDAEEAWLAEHYKKMPRTMLRYAIEKFPESTRQMYLKRD